MKTNLMVAAALAAWGVAAEPMKVALTFDDGEKTHLTIAAPLLERYGYRAIFNIVTDNVGKGGRMTWDDIRELKRRGHEIASHTLSHPVLPRLLSAGKTNEVVRQLAGSRDAIARELGAPPHYLCLPGNMSNPAVDALIRKERMEPLACGRPNFGEGTDAGTTNGVGAYIDRELKRGTKALVLMVHGVVRGGWRPFPTKEAFEGFLREIKEREGKCEVVPYAELAFRPHLATFAGECDGADGVYRCGETATVKVSVRDAAGLVRAGKFTAVVDDFHTNVLKTVDVDLSKGNPFEVTIVRQTPGFARVRVDRKNGVWCWGVGFEPEKLKKGSPSPADFDRFWAEAKAKLEREVPPDMKLEKVEERCTADFDYYRISFATFGRRVYGYLSVPTDRARAPFAAEVNVAAAGFGNWTNDMPGSKDRVGMFFSVYPFEPHWKWREIGLEGEYKKLHRQRYGKYLTGYPSSGLGVSREDAFFYPVILGVIRAIDWLAKQDYVDARRIRYQGTSQGGGMGLALCALNAHISKAALFVPALTDTMGYLAGRVSGWPRPVESQKPQFRDEAERNAPYFDGANFAARIKIPIRIAVGFSDTTCPPCAVYAAYNEIPAGGKGIAHGLGMTHACFRELYAELGAWLNAEAVSDADRGGFGPLTPSAKPCERQYLWPDGKMPYDQPQQVAEKSAVVERAGFDRTAHRRPFIEWYVPAASNRTRTCVLVVSGGGFNCCCDAERLQPVIDRFVRSGLTVANLTYRTPRPMGLPIHQTAWADAQRAVRLIRSQAAIRGFSPDRIGATGISAGAKTILLLALSSRTPAYRRVDAVDDWPCNLRFAIPQAPAYVLDDGASVPNVRRGIGAKIVPELAFDGDTCPLCLLQGGADIFSPLGSVRLYQRLRERGIAAELHLFADRWHGFHGDANRDEDGTAWDHWCDRMLSFVGIFEPGLLRQAPTTPPPSSAASDKPSARRADCRTFFACGTEDESLQLRMCEAWVRKWARGEQGDLHLEAKPMTSEQRASRFREFLNHRKVK